MAETVRFDRSLYDPGAVADAVEAHRHLATLVVTPGPEGIAVSFDDIDPRVADRLVDAVSNHALIGTIHAHRRIADRETTT